MNTKINIFSTIDHYAVALAVLETAWKQGIECGTTMSDIASMPQDIWEEVMASCEGKHPHMGIMACIHMSFREDQTEEPCATLEAKAHAIKEQYM